MRDLHHHRPGYGCWVEITTNAYVDIQEDRARDRA